ncbi:MAG: hypoxanthine phosphoribosyltransferase [Saprospiraceae bacterium]|nr:hypoxanthine phosphoribosyltransferase [Saprospiraceae bacterium]
MSAILKLHDLTFQPFISAQAINARVLELANTLSRDYAGKEPVFLAILNGSFIFAADLVRAFSGKCITSFVKLASYQGVSSSGEINTLIGMNFSLKDRHVIIVEDIIDSGLTMQNLLLRVKELNPASVAIISLLVKPDELAVPLDIDYCGFEIPSLFVVGYGMDYNELGRNLPGIWQLMVEE